MQHRKIAFIGAGNMSRSIISGMVSSGYPAEAITAANPSRPKLDALSNDFGINITQDNLEAVRNAEVVVLAVKPQLMEEVCKHLQQADLNGKLFVSIAAGIKAARLQQMLGGDYPLVRTMPNTPSALGKGMTGLYADSQVSDTDRSFAGDLLGQVGDVAWVDEEDMINGVIAAAGSSPAYFFLFLESMQDEALRMGFDRETSRKLVQQACLGAAEMVCQNQDLELSELRAQVTSKAGTTAAALNHFEDNGIRELVSGAMQAAVTRAKEMSDEF
ncbi:Pyrroline-5-carboxylate reductase [Saliniradius amylolyticus]|uniref:Pyrroline-5-carboxylate reductase n=2 Tax=Saliniradius amylolyticus TaxID=2183582 RepID=A0A2S2E5E1_9ALTE|nr:Pyrroline-5-carboxylate reductase [Saliniradius amylolyticus]